MSIKNPSPIVAMARIRCYPNDINTIQNFAPGTTEQSRTIAEKDLGPKVLGKFSKQQQKTKIHLLAANDFPDNNIILWNLKTYDIAMNWKGHSKAITSLVVLQDGHTFMSSSKDGSVIVYDISYTRYINKFFPDGVKTSANLLYLCNDLTHIAVGCENGSITIMKLKYQFSKT